MYYNNQDKDFASEVEGIILGYLSEEEKQAYDEWLAEMQLTKKRTYVPDLILPKGCAKLEWHKFTVVEVKHNFLTSTLQNVYSKFCQSEYYKKLNADIVFIYPYNPNVLLPEIDVRDLKVFDDIELFGKDLESIVLSKKKKKIRKDKLASNDEKLRRCKDEYNTGNCTLFIGAGVSISAGLPSWEKLLLRMKSDTEDKHVVGEDTKKVKRICDKSTMIEASYLKVIIDESKGRKYVDFVCDALYYREAKRESKLIESVVALIGYSSESGRKVNSIITYNYDDLLEDSISERLKIKPQIIDGAGITKKKTHFPVYHVHGVIPKYHHDGSLSTGKIVLSEEDYHRLYNRPSSWTNMIQQSALKDTTCIFIGMSMNDPNLRRLLSVMKKEGRTHYAFLQRTKLSNEELTKKNEETMDQMFLELGVNVIWYDDHEELPGLLMGLME